jgi:hypothetical protein
LPADANDGTVPFALLRRFAAAESTIYPLAMTDPESYERVVTVVGIVFRRLRDDCPTVDALVVRLPAAAEQAAQLAEAEGLGLDPAVIADAAAVLRYRELRS